MDVNEIMQYVMYALALIGAMAFVVSVITQVIKELPGLTSLPTSAVVFALSIVLCPATFIALMAWQKQKIYWYMVFACMIAAFVVALVAMQGWDSVRNIWNRTKYSKNE